MFGIAETIGDAFVTVWYGLWILIDTLIYSLISLFYQLFNLIAKASLYNSENGDIATIVDRISIILGIGMLFILAYNIILLIMNPDKFSAGGDKSMQGLFKNAVISIVMLTAYSTIFTYMTKLQNSIIDSQVIENVILGSGDTSSEIKSSNMGSMVATKIFMAFYYPVDKDGNYLDCGNISYDETGNIITDAVLNEASGKKLCDKYQEGIIAASNGNINALLTDSYLFSAMKSGPPGIKYMYIISSICGVVALLMFISYVIDIGIRVAKMAFLQIIAPIPIMAYITKPNGGVFSKWLDNLIKTYLSLFMRLITIYFSMFLISLLTSQIGNNSGGVFGNSENVSGILKLFGNVVLILGVLLFAKDAPKLLENLLGTTFGEGGGFSPKAIAKKLGGAYDTATKVPFLGKKFDQGVSGLAGAAGAGWSAFRNNRKLKKGGKGAEGLTHMDVKTAMQQGRARGMNSGGGVGQFNSQGKKVYESTYGYGKKQGFFGGKSRDTRRDEKYGKAYDNNVKEHAEARNDEIRNQAIGQEIPNDAATTRMKASDYMNDNAEFATNSQSYKDAAKFVDDEARTKGITLTPEERKAKINERLSQIAATTTNEKEKRAINSYLARDKVISEYQSTVLGGNQEAIAKIKQDASSQTKAIVKAEIDSKGLNGVITDQNVKLQLEGAAQAKVSGVMASVKGDISKLNIDASSMGKINATAVANVEAQINNAGGIGNITLTAEQQASVNATLQAKVAEAITKAGGTSNIALDATSQATLATTEQAMKNNANSEIEARLNNEFTSADEAKIRNEIYSNSTVDEGGIIRTLSPQELKERADKAVTQAKEDKRQEITGEVFDKLNDSIAKVRDGLVKKQVAGNYKDEATKAILINEQTTKEAEKFIYDQEYKASVEEHLYKQKYNDVENKLMIEATDAAISKMSEVVMNYEEGRIKGDYTNNKDGSLDSVYNAEYVQNEKISTGGVKTKSAEDLAWDKIKKAVLDQDKKK